MATANQIRQVAIELSENVAALKASVDAVSTAVLAMTINELDAALPTAADVKTQLAAFNSINKQSMNISDAIAAVNAV